MAGLNFTLSPLAAQRVHDALSCLSKFSEYVSLEARRNRLILSALNSSKSAYGGITLASGKFFDTYHFPAMTGGGGGGVGRAGEEPRFTCRFFVKALLSAFRQRYFENRDKETAIEKCEVRFVETPSTGECRMLVKLLCRHGVLKTYKLTYEEVDVMHALFDRDLARNKWCIKSRLLREYMEHFGPKAEQLDISSENGRVAFTSFTEKLMDGKEILKQPLQTSVAIDTADFEMFAAEDELHIAVSLKDFKAIVTHADSMHSQLWAHYSDPGRPLQAVYDLDGMTCEFTLMTLGDTRSSQGFAAITRIQPRRAAPPAPPPPQSSAHTQPQPSADPPPPPTGTLSPQTEPPMAGYEQSGSLYRPQSRPMTTQGTSAPPVRSLASPSALQDPMEPVSASEIPASAVAPEGLFRSYTSSEDDGDSDDDLGKGLDLWDAPMLRWDTGVDGDISSRISVVRDKSPPPLRPSSRAPEQIVPRKRRIGGSGDTTQSQEDADEEEEEEEEEGTGEGLRTATLVVGPTQGVSQAKGLFD